MRSEDAALDIAEASARLYSAPLPEFVATRDALAKEVTDKAAAKRIRGLRKPTVPAWLANQLARRHPDDMETLVRTGDEMRAATANRDGRRLRELSAEGRQIVGTLVQHARRIADETGQAVSGDAAEALETTLHAAMADPGAAQVVLTGRLARPLGHAGFGAADVAGDPVDTMSPARPEPDPSAPPSADVQGTDGVETAVGTTDQSPGLVQASADVAAAEAVVDQRTAERLEAARRLDEAQQAREDARDDAETARRTADEARDELERIRLEFEEAQRVFEAAQTELEQAEAESERAGSEARAAEHELQAREAELNQARRAADEARERRRRAATD
ncbi:hypothetical protein [Phytoactinopolyspora mesophila]|uniref:Uncharacterized protein n=1 Tax=Phytoactinopolyspora mesophila TaxID=2650750 RepID=A0A7K3M647_9ACTN|nr:hypothetical protein [Phytoactinopolyspora mesophila]NDL58372.1 hypothetical protein [Phytoactinopolyspora mesophila]